MNDKNRMKELPMYPGSWYCITINGNKGRKVFSRTEGVAHVLSRLKVYLKPLGKIYAVNVSESFLMLVIKYHKEVKLVEWARNASVDFKEVTEHMKELAKNARAGTEFATARELISLSFRRLGTGIAMAYNGATDNDGHVLERRPKRELLKNEEEIKSAILQVHLSSAQCCEHSKGSSMDMYMGLREMNEDIENLIHIYTSGKESDIRWHLKAHHLSEEIVKQLSTEIHALKSRHNRIKRIKFCLPTCQTAKNLYQKAFPNMPSMGNFAAIVLFCNLY